MDSTVEIKLFTDSWTIPRYKLKMVKNLDKLVTGHYLNFFPIDVTEIFINEISSKFFKFSNSNDLFDSFIKSFGYFIFFIKKINEEDTILTFYNKFSNSEFDTDLSNLYIYSTIFKFDILSEILECLIIKTYTYYDVDYFKKFLGYSDLLFLLGFKYISLQKPLTELPDISIKILNSLNFVNYNKILNRKIGILTSLLFKPINFNYTKNFDNIYTGYKNTITEIFINLLYFNIITPDYNLYKDSENYYISLDNLPDCENLGNAYNYIINVINNGYFLHYTNNELFYYLCN